jgi:hypothetical protein
LVVWNFDICEKGVFEKRQGFENDCWKRFIIGETKEKFVVVPQLSKGK